MPATLRHLTAADLKTLIPTAKEWVTLAEESLRQAGAGSGADNAAAWKADAAAAGLKLPAGAGAVSALLGADGAPRLLVDAQAFGIARDAGCVAVAARHLADPKSEVFTLLGGDRRGRAIIEALQSEYPHAERMLCFDPDVTRQEQFADEIMTQLNLASIIPAEPREATEGAHILVLNLAPGGAWPAPIIEHDWLQRGTLCIALYPGAGLAPAARKRADRRVTDNLAAFNACAAERFPDMPAPDCELAAIVAGRAPGRGAGNPLVIHFVFGSPALDVALAERLLRRAEQANRGTVL